MQSKYYTDDQLGIETRISFYPLHYPKNKAMNLTTLFVKDKTEDSFLASTKCNIYFLKDAKPAIYSAPWLMA